MGEHWLDTIYQSLDPVALSLGPFEVRWYGLAYLAGFMLCALVIWRLSRRFELDLTADDISNIMLAIILGVVLGGRLGYVLFYGAGYYLAHPLSIFALHEGGMSFHGGLLGAIIAVAICCYKERISFLTVADLICCGAPLGLFLGRLANFVNGELWGKPTDLPWGVMFESGGGLYRHPSQLYEAVLEGLVIFVVLFVLSRKRPARPQGSFLGTFLLLYGIFRFLIEFVRVPDAQLGYLASFLTMGQLLSLPLIVMGILLLLSARLRAKNQIAHI